MVSRHFLIYLRSVEISSRPARPGHGSRNYSSTKESTELLVPTGGLFACGPENRTGAEGQKACRRQFRTDFPGSWLYEEVRPRG